MLEGPRGIGQSSVPNQQQTPNKKRDEIKEESIPESHVSQETTGKTQAEFNRTFSQSDLKIPAEKKVAGLEQKVTKAKQDLNKLKAEENKLNEEKKTKNNSDLSEIQNTITHTELRISSLENQLKAARPPQEKPVPLEKRNWKTRLANSRFAQLFKNAYKSIINARAQSSIKSKEKQLNSIEEKFNKIEASQLDIALMNKSIIRTVNSLSKDLEKMIKEGDDMKQKLDKNDKEYRAKFKQIDDFINRADALLKRINEF